MSHKTFAAPKHDHLDDELLSNVYGGSGSRPPGPHGGGAGGTGTGGGDGLGWLRKILRELLR